MKSTLLGLICIISSIALIPSAYGFSLEEKSIFEIQPLVENITKLEDSLQQHIFPFPLLHKGLERFCPSGFSSHLNTHISNIQNIWNQSSQQLTPTLLRQHYARLLTLTQSISSWDPQQYCSQKSLLYQLLQSLHEQFWSSLSRQETKLIPTTPSLPPTTKTTPTEHNSAVHLVINHHKEAIPADQHSAIKLVDSIFHSVFNDLHRLKILSTSDLEQLDWNILVNYRPSCEKTKGSFHLLQSKQSTNKRFKALKFTISVCPNIPPSQFVQHIKQILAHELGHYLYFFRDPQATNFDQLCRSNSHNQCQQQHFVSEYAQTNKEEDYAESFAYRYLSLQHFEKEKEFWSAPQNPILYQKYQHFTTLSTLPYS